MLGSYHEHEQSSSIIYSNFFNVHIIVRCELEKNCQEKEGIIWGELSRESWKKRDLSIRKSFTFFWKPVWCVSLCGQFFQCGLVVSNNGDDGKELFYHCWCLHEEHWQFAMK